MGEEGEEGEGKRREGEGKRREGVGRGGREGGGGGGGGGGEGERRETHDNVHAWIETLLTQLSCPPPHQSERDSCGG